MLKFYKFINTKRDDFFYFRFTYINIGFPGKCHDAGIFQTSELKAHIENGKIPKEYHLIGDGAFPLTVNMMKPFPGNNLEPEQRQFNYRLSRARMTVENTFGRLKARWRILIKFSEMDFKKTVMMITTCCILHNMCENEDSVVYKDWLDEVAEFDNVYSQPDQEEHHFNQKEGDIKRKSIMNTL